MSERLTPEEGDIPIDSSDIDSLREYANGIREDHVIASQLLSEKFSGRPSLLYMNPGMAISSANGNQAANYYDAIVECFESGTPLILMRNVKEIKEEPRYTIGTPFGSSYVSPLFPWILGQKQLIDLAGGLFPMPFDSSGSQVDLLLANHKKIMRIKKLKRGQEVLLKPSITARPTPRAA